MPTTTKKYGFYILNFGSAALANEDAWFTGLTVRSTTVKNKLAGGMGQLFKVYMNMFFNLADGCDFRIGVTLSVPPAASAPATAASAQDRSLVLADLAMVVQDAEAHQYAFGWKGAGSTKCCPLCVNIVSKNCNLVRDPTGGTIPVYTTDTSRFRLMSDKTCRSMQHRLHQLALHQGVKGEGARLRIQIPSAQLAPRHRARCATDAGARL